MAARAGGEADGKGIAAGRPTLESGARARERPRAEPALLQCSEKAGAIVKNNENTMATGDAAAGERARQGAECLQSLKKNGERRVVQRSRMSRCDGNNNGRNSRTTIGNNSLGNFPARKACNPGSGGRKEDAERGSFPVVPPAHFGAAGAAGVWALGVDFFLPLAGAVGSSCA